MTRMIALLRGVNVGKAKRVPMAELRALLAHLGYRDVATLLNSGNAVFTVDKGKPADQAAAIADGLLRAMKVDVPVVVKTTHELTAIVDENPLAHEAAHPARLLVAFVPAPRQLASLAPLADLVKPPEKFCLGRHAAYLHCPAGLLQSAAGAALLGKVGRAATTRNWATTLKLLALAQGAGKFSEGRQP